MSFIGIISDNKTFENIKNRLTENIKNYKLNIINITMKSIENIKNVKFETIIIESELEKYKDYAQTIENFCKEAKYVIINTDLNKEINNFKNINNNIITYGLNHEAIITISSVTENDILICLQKNIKNIDEQIIEMQEKRIIKKENCNLKIYEILIIYIIIELYNQKIMQEM